MRSTQCSTMSTLAARFAMTVVRSSTSSLSSSTATARPVRGAARTGSSVNCCARCIPTGAQSGMFDKFRDVVTTGIPYQGHRVQYADPGVAKTGIEGKRKTGVLDGTGGQVR